MKCEHVFKGHAEGVTCMRCGLRMSAEEYAEYLNPPQHDPEQPPKDNPEQEIKPEANQEPMPEQNPDTTPKQEPESTKKPKRARKPKEEPEHE